MPRESRVTIASLNSWKEIAVYMGRGVRTVQRWEQELGLPIHRLGTGLRAPVHAFPSELSAWQLRTTQHQQNNNGHAPQPHVRLHPDGTSATSRVLVQRSSHLVHQLVDAMWVQRQRAERLNKLMEQVRKRFAPAPKSDHSESTDAKRASKRGKRNS